MNHSNTLIPDFSRPEASGAFRILNFHFLIFYFKLTIHFLPLFFVKKLIVNQRKSLECFVY